MVKIRSLCFEKIISINRCSKVVRGGRRFSFSALAVVGNKNGCIGIGFGKASEVPSTIKKALNNAKRNLLKIDLNHLITGLSILGKYNKSSISLKIVSSAIGIKANSKIKYIFEALGLQNVIVKSFGSNNPLTLVKAVLNALKKLICIFESENIRKHI
ncbi:30S ribosomal protein S5 [Candidatus Pinguicoccus supinus]|uniref:Small ribosomal subunit protein uS5 n=1 Tax=Candidatus Pinguicoccus supinus TaxID=2529394 RepID=A0A7T0FYC2_9BACT|nr:30S ribosomal protein S5 [Candidatus Pinguicoccus supinus]